MSLRASLSCSLLQNWLNYNVSMLSFFTSTTKNDDATAKISVAITNFPFLPLSCPCNLNMESLSWKLKLSSFPQVLKWNCLLALLRQISAPLFPPFSFSQKSRVDGLWHWFLEPRWVIDLVHRDLSAWIWIKKLGNQLSSFKELN